MSTTSVSINNAFTEPASSRRTLEAVPSLICESPSRLQIRIGATMYLPTLPRKTKLRLPLFAVIVLALSLVNTAQAAPTVRWTPAQAAAKIKATYTTVDQKAYDYAKERGLEEAMRVQLHAAKPTRVTCKGSGTAVAGRYARFRCVVTVQGSARIPPDYVLYTATKRVTARLVGSRLVVSG